MTRRPSTFRLTAPSGTSETRRMLRPRAQNPASRGFRFSLRGVEGSLIVLLRVGGLVRRSFTTPAEGGGDRVERGPYPGVVPDVPVLAPLQFGVDADQVRLDRLVDTEVGGQVLQGLLPDLILHLVAAHAQAHLVEGIVGPHQDLGLGDGGALLLDGAERDPTGE